MCNPRRAARSGCGPWGWTPSIFHAPFGRETVEKTAHCAIGRGQEDLHQSRRAGDLNGAKFHPLRFRHRAKNRAES